MSIDDISNCSEEAAALKEEENNSSSNSSKSIDQIKIKVDRNANTSKKETENANEGEIAPLQIA